MTKGEDAGLFVYLGGFENARWIPCSNCDEWWCRFHEKHVFECGCPGIEELGFDPYSEGY